MDSACQTLRPRPVIEAVAAYYRERNACGGRVQYRWGREVDVAVHATRQALLSMAGKRREEFAAAFTLNTTYGINLVLHQLPGDGFDAVVTSDIEHNSVLLPTMVWAKTHGKQRIIVQRGDDGSLPTEKIPPRSLVVVNSTSNIDGRTLVNAQEVAATVHDGEGILLLDAAQTFGHDAAPLAGIDADAIFGSGHKMYGPSSGFTLIRRSLLRRLRPTFLGGGTVSDVRQDGYDLLAGEEEHAILEPGLQDWAGIVGLGAAVTWLRDARPGGMEPAAYEAMLAARLWEGLRALPRINLFNTAPSPVVSLWIDGLDAHRLALYLDGQSIMCRSGHFCCHYFLQHCRSMPPLLRVSLGLHNTPADIDHLCGALAAVIHSL